MVRNTEAEKVNDAKANAIKETFLNLDDFLPPELTFQWKGKLYDVSQIPFNDYLRHSKQVEMLRKAESGTDGTLKIMRSSILLAVPGMDQAAIDLMPIGTVLVLSEFIKDVFQRVDRQAREILGEDTEGAEANEETNPST